MAMPLEYQPLGGDINIARFSNLRKFIRLYSSNI